MGFEQMKCASAVNTATAKTPTHRPLLQPPINTRAASNL